MIRLGIEKKDAQEGKQGKEVKGKKIKLKKKA